MASNKDKKELIKKLKSDRKQISAQLDRFHEFISNSDILTNKLSIKERYVRCEALWDNFNSVQLELEYLETSQEDDRQTFEEKFFETICKFKDLLNDPVPSVNSTFSPVNIQQNFVKLPPLDLPTFSGNYDSWLGFFDTFVALIHSNSSLSDVQKFYYLKSCLKGDAAQVIHSIEVSDLNYEIAFKILRERYENKKFIIQSHVKCLYELPVVGKNTLNDLRSLADNIQKNLRALKSLKEPVDSWDTLLLYMFSNKLDMTSKREWETFCVKQDRVSCNDFFKFLTERCHVLENLDTHKINFNQSQISSSKPGFKGYKNSQSFVALENNDNNVRNNICPYCKVGKHPIFYCSNFLSLNESQRINETKKLHLCLNCFKSNHISTRCSYKGCQKCGKPHNTLLHIDYSKQNKENSTPKQNLENNSPKNNTELPVGNTSVSTHSSVNSLCESEVLLSTAKVLILDSEGNTHEVKALLDCGSQSNFITSDLVSKLNLDMCNVNMSVVGINTSVTRSSKSAQITIKSKFNEFAVKLNVYVLDKITSALPMLPVNINNLKIPSNINLADSTFHIPSKIDILLGANIFYELLLIGQIKTAENMPILQKTRFGWIISGNVPPVEQNVANTVASNHCQTICHFSRNESIDNQIERFWKIEEVEPIKFQGKEERECEELFIKTTRHASDGKFIVQLPTKEGIESIGDSREIAERRFFKLEKKLSLNKTLKNEYGKFMKEYEELGHMTVIPDTEIDSTDNTVYYMPHHGVIKEDSTTTKLRVVFDASAKTNMGISLNEKLKIGPVIQDDLYSILIRFRQHNFVLGADAEKMYRQVWVQPQQRDLQRIVWRPNPEEELKHYRMNTVTYGTTPASFLAIRCLHKAAEEQEDLHPRACYEIKKNFYVDDLLTGASTIEEILELKTQITSVLQKSGFCLRKWVSNSKEILKDIKENNVKQYIVDEDVTKTLGLIWNIHEDSLQYTIRIESHLRSTKRNILAALSKIFDPLGLVGPIVIRAKIIMQKLWKNGVDWDEEVSFELHNLWRQFYDDLPCLNNLQVPRHALCVKPIKLELHGYCDSSEKAYGACLYMRSVNTDGKIIVHILCAKSKVAPIKTLTLPRLELCGALLLSRIIKKTLQALSIKIDQVTCWTDSKIVLSWLASEPGRWNVFVAHRVAEIQQNGAINNWIHVASEENPADLISRGCNTNQLINSRLWWYGPEWLTKEEYHWPKGKLNYDLDIPEQRKTRVVMMSTVDVNMFLKFSSFLRLQRVIAYCVRFYKNLKLNKNERIKGCLTVDELENALIILVKISQSLDFEDEIQALKANKLISKSSKLISLNPFLDSNQVLRMGGRLAKASVPYDQKCPIILSNNNFLTDLIIAYQHRKNLHMGPQNLLASIRSKFWILGGMSMIKKALRRCVVCFRAKPRGLNTLMGELPEQRVKPTKPFFNCGVDYAGPFNIKSSRLRQSKVLKAYLCVFVCFVTRAVHLEVVSDLTTDCFLNALKRFIARRGKCRNIFSDCGTNFVGASNEMREFFKLLKGNEFNNKIVDYLSQDGINWKFIPPRSPHFGGLWEAGVRQAKYHLKRIVGNASLTFEELSTVFAQIEACLNSRPLSALSSDPNDLSPLTPGHFLVGESLVALPESDERDVNCGRLKRYRYLKQMVQHFWDRWSKECLNELGKRTKWQYPNGPNIKIGDLVVLKEENLPPLKWSLGRVVELYPGHDGIVRVVKIKTVRGSFKRAVAKLCLLPLE